MGRRNDFAKRFWLAYNCLILSDDSEGGKTMEDVIGPVVAGKFYPGKEGELVDKIESCYTGPHGPGEIPTGSREPFPGPVGLIVPHAGYPYSGPVAAHGYRWMGKLGRPEAVVIVGTNHSGLGPEASLLAEGGWSTPLGTVEVDVELGGRILDASERLQENRSAFLREHSIEVQLPFLQGLWGSDFSIVPICLKDQGREVAADLAAALAETVSPETLLIASTDFSHYEAQEVAEEKDARAIGSIMNREIDELYERVRDHHISICGYGAIAVLLDFALREDLHPTQLKYATSGEVAGYGREVVGYSAIGFRG